jgi:MoaA/NifB/PqqE/SkfB family radical SAM enzyme
MSLQQVFLYVTQKCNIRCVTCYALDQLERDDDLPVDELLRVLRTMRAEGAWKLSFLGGEPTVHPRLAEIAAAARAMGFRFVRVNTNGMFKASWLEAPGTRAIDVFCFSIDGATAAVNDAIRKGARLERVLANMRLAASLGYDVRANMTVTSRNVDQIADVIALVQGCGGTEVNINVMFQMGYALDREDLAVAPARWREAYDAVVRRHREFTVRIKIPPAFAARDEVPRHRAEGHRCAAADGTRRYVSSNGDVYPCLVMMDRPAPESPADLADDALHDHCHFVKMKVDGELPLCIFHKTRLNG